jgi:hypothetical protein
MAKRIPEFTATNIHKVEPVGGDLVRIYFSLERSAAWDCQVTVLMPAPALLQSALFLKSSTREIMTELAGAEGRKVERLQ